ncbi:MAG: YkgJ family cysteine cluster protein [Chloroflexi bacterium]|nr:YkgJ family cysteine cluster protein [Chloroflexota bacterium]
MKAYIRMQDGSERKVGDEIVPIECFRCGTCCTRFRPEVSKREIERIARKLRIPIETFFAEYVRRVPIKEGYILQSSDDKCPFLRRDEESVKSACTIYAFRPKACRDWVPSLSRVECREGLSSLKGVSELLLPQDIFDSVEQIERFSSTARADE